jgi:hypothetical protein
MLTFDRSWAIRNCGLIFIRSLFDFLLGSHESKSLIEAGWDGKTMRIYYQKYPQLPNVILGLLEAGPSVMEATTITTSAESVFPALDIIRRAGPPNELRDELHGKIVRYLDSSVWHVREIAARTLCSCLLHEGWLEAVEKVLKDAQANQGNGRRNCLHGALLLLKYMIEKLSQVMPQLLTSKSCCVRNPILYL